MLEAFNATQAPPGARADTYPRLPSRRSLIVMAATGLAGVALAVSHAETATAATTLDWRSWPCVA